MSTIFRSIWKECTEFSVKVWITNEEIDLWRSVVFRYRHKQLFNGACYIDVIDVSLLLGKQEQTMVFSEEDRSLSLKFCVKKWLRIEKVYQQVYKQKLISVSSVKKLLTKTFKLVLWIAKGTLNLREWTKQEWTIIRHHIAGLEFVGVDKSARCGKGGHCRSGQCGTMWQGWTMPECTMRHHVAGMDNVGVDNAGVVKCPWKMCSRVKTRWKSPTVCEINSHVISTHSSRFRT